MIPSKTLDALTEGREGFDYDAEGNFSGAGGEKSVDLLRLHYLYSSMKLELKTGMKILCDADYMLQLQLNLLIHDL